MNGSTVKKTVVQRTRNRYAGDYYYHRSTSVSSICISSMDPRLGNRLVRFDRFDDQRYPVRHATNGFVPIAIKKQKIKRLLRNCNGSFTLETTIWFPVVLLLIVIGLIAGLIIYQHATLYSLAVQTAERTAYSWDNSYKEIVTGKLDGDQDDGLYWRLLSDGAVPFLNGGAGRPVIIELPIDRASSEDKRSLPEKKLQRSGSLLPSGVYGEIRYENLVMEKAVTVSLRRPLRLPLSLNRLFGDELEAEARSIVSDPAEYIRGIDMIRTYTGWLDTKRTPQEALSLFTEPEGEGQAADVSSHTEAARWLRLQTGGVSSSYTTELGVRQIDSLTNNEEAHQAFYTYRDNQVLLQADKDAELLRDGRLNAVVWHFFRGTNNRIPEPSERLLDELAARGIRVIIHPGGEH